MTDFILNAPQAAFPDVFSLRPDPTYQNPTAIESECVEEVTKSLGYIVRRWSEHEKSDSNYASVLHDIRHLCSEIVNELQSEASRFCNATGGQERDTIARRLISKSYFLKGVFEERRAAIARRPFEVSALSADPVSDPNFPIIDVKIIIRDVSITEEQQKFKVKIDETRRVMRVVLLDRARQAQQRTRSAFARLQLTPPERDTAEGILRRLHEYMTALVGISKVGLMNSHSSQAPFATLALNGLQQEFVDREAAAVKNTYIERLGIWAFSVAALGFALYFLSDFLPHDSVPFRFRRFFLLFSGAAVGTWLSFSLRRVVLQFHDLATLEDDRLSPRVRVFFVLFLTLVVGLFFWTRAITIELGAFSSDFRENGAFAVLVGALCGIAERGLATSVMKRADDFISGVGRQS